MVSITEKLKEDVAKLAEKHGLVLVVIFGSQATGKTHPLSDVDIAFLAEKDTNYSEEYNIESDLHKIFGTKNIELVNMRKISPFFMKQISDNGRLLYEDVFGRFIEFKVIAFKLFMEAKPLIMLNKKLMRNSSENYVRKNIVQLTHNYF